MSTLDDFWGSSSEPLKECSQCGKKDGQLVPTAWDESGVTHFSHPHCLTVVFPPRTDESWGDVMESEEDGQEL